MQQFATLDVILQQTLAIFQGLSVEHQALLDWEGPQEVLKLRLELNAQGACSVIES